MKIVNGEEGLQIPTDWVAFWKFANANANDEGEVHNGTISGATTTTDNKGNANSALLFGVGNYVQIPHHVNLNPGLDDWSISMWVYPTAVRSCNIYDKNISGGGYNANFWSDNYVYTYTQAQLKSTSQYAINNWYHYVSVRSATQLKLYLQGTLNAQMNIGNSNIGNTNSLYFARDNNGSYLFAGKLCKIRIFRRILTTDEITALANE